MDGILFASIATGTAPRLSRGTASQPPVVVGQVAVCGAGLVALTGIKPTDLDPLGLGSGLVGPKMIGIDDRSAYRLGPLVQEVPGRG